MKIWLKRISTFIPNNDYLETKWWHRLLKVIFLITLVVFFLISLAISLVSLTPNKQNAQIIDNLHNFSASSDQKVINTIPNFLEIGGELGCFNSNNSISNVSEYLLKKSFCSKDLVSQVEEAVNFHNNVYPGANYTKSQFLEKLNKDTEKRYCFIDKDVACPSVNIVKYKKTGIFYIEAITQACLAVLLWSLIWISLYKVLLYVIYGNKNKHLEINQQ